ncbi:MAG: TnpV protein [Oscillospiraceae bacterium]|nr:TnpV protein [Oscillospiraceae bacterium]
MDKYIYDESNGLWYELQGRYYLPCLTLPPEEEKFIGIWGQRHLRYIKEHKRLFYVNLLTSGKLNSYLADINEQAEELFFRLVKQFAEKEGITEELKSASQMAWIGAMNDIQARTREIIYADLIYA